MWYGVGIDLGTSFTSAAVGDGAGIRMVPLSPSIVVPSMAAPTADGHLLTGLDAAETVDAPSRIARGFKRRLGDPSPLILGGSVYSPAALMAAQLRDVLAEVTRTMGRPPGSVVLTYPAIWGPYRREQFTEVPRLAGLDDYRLLTEPEAAATHYSSERHLGDGEVVAVYDLGGGTFDTTILRMRSGGMEILGTPEGIEHMGGVDFDDALIAGLDERLEGAISALDPEEPEAASALSAIRDLAVKAKVDLSIEPDVTVSVPLLSGPREIVLSRLEFNEMIAPSVRQTIEALRRTIASAGLRPDDLSAVLLAGGSSRVPLVAQMVSQEFGKPVRVTLHPKYTVALGAATLATRVPAPALPAPTGQGEQGPIATSATRTQAPPVPLNGGSNHTGTTRRKKLLAVCSAAAAVIVAAATTIVLSVPDDRVPAIAVTGDSDTSPATTSSTNNSTSNSSTTTTTSSSTTSSSASTESLAPSSAQDGTRSTLEVFHLKEIPPWVGRVGSEATGWSGRALSPGGVQDGSITAKFDGKGGLEVTWDGTGAAQVYFHSQPNGDGESQDLSQVFDNNGALVFDVAVHKRPVSDVTAEVHCTYPCRSETKVTSLLKRLPVGQKETIAIPARCFTENRSDEWDPTKINTAFLIRTDKAFSATFSDVRWTFGAAKRPAAIPCDKLT